MVRVHVVISGFVQGVGFRYFIERKARELGLAGWVRNAADGNVEAIFEGQEEAVKKVITECKKGPFLANVANIEVSTSEAIGDMQGFTIRFDEY